MKGSSLILKVEVTDMGFLGITRQSILNCELLFGFKRIRWTLQKV